MSDLRMITALDHVAIGVHDLAAAEAATSKLLALQASWRGAQVLFRVANMHIELATAESEGLSTIAFRTDDADAAFRTLERRGLASHPPRLEHDTDSVSGARFGRRRLTLAPEGTHGVSCAVVERSTDAQPMAVQTADSPVTGLDHVVIRTPDPDRAAAFYGARLGLDMRLDRSSPQWGARLMFFRCGDLIVEIAHDLKAGVSGALDQFWGLSWRVANADAAHARLKVDGFNVSEVRTGRKPGTRVFTVRDRTLGVPTLMVEPARRES